MQTECVYLCMYFNYLLKNKNLAPFDWHEAFRNTTHFISLSNRDRIVFYDKGRALWELHTDIWVSAAVCRRLQFRWQRPCCDEGWVRSYERWEWDVRCSPGLSNRFVSLRWSSVLSLLPFVWVRGAGVAIGGWPCQIGPRRHDAHGFISTITFWTITLISFGKLAQSSS